VAKIEHGLGQSNTCGRRVILIALTASMLIHVGFIVSAVFLMSRRASPPPNRYLYVTLASARPSIGVAAGGHTGIPGEAHQVHLPKASRDMVHVRHAVPIATQVPREAPLRPQSREPALPLKSSPPAPAVANSNDAGNSPGSVPGGNHGEDSAGSLSGVAAYQAPVLLSSVTPGYPESARIRGIEGEVVLRFVVDRSGGVEPDIKVVSSLPMLDQAAIDAVRRWRFSPARDREGNPVRVQVSVPLQFTLR
jgi:protein TonB